MFYDTFIRLCTEKNESPNSVAKKLGLSTGTVTWWKKGRIPRETMLLKLADYFGVSVDYLLGKTEQKEKPTAESGELEDEDTKELRELAEKLSPERLDLVLRFAELLAGLPDEPKKS